MNRFFDLNNAIFLKYQEIQVKFIDGILALNGRLYPVSVKANGLNKLVRLKEGYEAQLEEASTTPAKIKDVVICFKCFDKEKPCDDCD